MGKLLKVFGKVIVKALPLIGDAVENKESEDGGKGKFQWGKFWGQLIRIAGTVGSTLLMNS